MKSQINLIDLLVKKTKILVNYKGYSNANKNCKYTRIKRKIF